MFDEEVRQFYENATEVEIEEIKTREFASWLKFYVSNCGRNQNSLPTWLVEMAHGLNTVATAYPRFCTRGYAFRKFEPGKTRPTADYGIASKSGNVAYYGILNEILEVRYPGMLDLRCIVFMAEWYDPIVGRGVREDQNGVISVHSRLRLRNYDPFILASQADQVCYIPYPRINNRSDPWITVTPIHPRGKIYGVPEQDALQEGVIVPREVVEIDDEIDFAVECTTNGDDEIDSQSEEPLDEFDEDVDSIPSEYCSEDSA